MHTCLWENFPAVGWLVCLFLVTAIDVGTLPESHRSGARLSRVPGPLPVQQRVGVASSTTRGKLRVKAPAAPRLSQAIASTKRTFATHVILGLILGSPAPAPPQHALLEFTRGKLIAPASEPRSPDSPPSTCHPGLQLSSADCLTSGLCLAHPCNPRTQPGKNNTTYLGKTGNLRI